MGAAARQKAVLAIGAQPVDVAYFCAGTLALFQERNWQIVPAAVTGGEEAVPAVLEAEWQCLFSPSFSIFLPFSRAGEMYSTNDLSAPFFQNFDVIVRVPLLA